jgi:aminoglycoside phosphotransferase (APT) family kinase protein
VDEETARRRLREALPELASGDVEPIRSGWDSHAFAIDCAWIVRVPRRPETEEALRREARLLGAIETHLPVPVPAPVHVSVDSPVCVVSRRIDGKPATANPATGRSLGGFLAALHGIATDSVPLPASDTEAWQASHEQRRHQFEDRVFPLLSADERERANDLFASVKFDFEPTVVHGDLGPDHILCGDDGQINGVIDWTDARLGDPAIDLAWALHGTDDTFAKAVAAAYGNVTTRLRERAAFYHRRGPWYEVLYGLETDRRDLVASGLAGVRARL